VLLVDDILFSPFNSILWIFREIHKNAQMELSNEADSITQQLRNLYMQLETGRLTEEQFSLQERILLDRMDELAVRRERAEEAAEDADTAEDGEDAEDTDAAGSETCGEQMVDE
jgi:Gas vesicle protein G